jgi:hypothetical protein
MQNSTLSNGSPTERSNQQNASCNDATWVWLRGASYLLSGLLNLTSFSSHQDSISDADTVILQNLQLKPGPINIIILWRFREERIV